MRFLIFNGAKNTTAAPVKVTTGTAIKTMLQIAPLVPMYVVEWGFSVDGSAAATPGEVELVETGAIAATVTATASADITAYDADALLWVAGGGSMSSFFTLSTSGTGYTATVEGSTTVARNLAGPQLVAPTTELIEQFPLGDRPLLQSGDFTRIRCTFGAAVNAYCYVILSVGQG